MPRKPPPTPRPRLSQTRLAGPNHHSTTKNTRAEKSSKSLASPRQSALSSFGFSKEVTSTGSSDNGKKRVYASDDEIAETQFGFATQSFEEEEMGPPPVTPKRRRKGWGGGEGERREVPSSHSPPGSPWTPKGVVSGGIPFRLEEKKEEEGEGEERVVKSSQWWENEEVLDGLEEEEVVVEPTIASSLSPTVSLSPSLPTREIKQEDQSPSPPSPSPQTTRNNSQVNILTTTTQIPINFRDTPISPPPRPSIPPVAAADEPEAEESQEPQLPYHHGDHGDDDEIPLPSPTQSMGEGEFERDDDDDDNDDDVDPDGLHAFNPVRTQQLPSSFYHHDGRESSPPALPAVLTGGFSSQGLPVGEEEGEDEEGEGVEEVEEVEGVEVEEVVEEEIEGENRPITVSQLLPSSLMETFPLPPPLSQFSSYGYEVVPGSETQ